MSHYACVTCVWGGPLYVCVCEVLYTCVCVCVCEVLYTCVCEVHPGPDCNMYIHTDIQHVKIKYINNINHKNNIPMFTFSMLRLVAAPDTKSLEKSSSSRFLCHF
jgi:hypothetical protein